MRGCFDSVNFSVKGRGPQERIRDRGTITLKSPQVLEVSSISPEVSSSVWNQIYFIFFVSFPLSSIVIKICYCWFWVFHKFPWLLIPLLLLCLCSRIIQFFFVIFENPFTPPAFKPTDSDMKCGFLIVLIFFIYVLSFFIIFLAIFSLLLVFAHSWAWDYTLGRQTMGWWNWHERAWGNINQIKIRGKTMAAILS